MLRSEVQLIRRLFTQRGTLMVSIALCAFLFFQLVAVVRKSAETDASIDLLRAESVRLAKEQKTSERIRALLETDYFAEREARTKLGYTKKGEHAVIITGGDPVVAAPLENSPTLDAGLPARSVSTEVNNVHDDNAKRWLRFFFSR